MTLRMHFNSSMFLPSPYVVRIKHTDSTRDNLNLSEFIKYRKIAKEQIKSTWGYSNPAFEIIKTNNEQVLSFFGHNVTYNMPVEECHSYWIFTDEADALQFRLTAGESIHMHMWSSKIKFTIYEYGPG